MPAGRPTSGTTCLNDSRLLRNRGRGKHHRGRLLNDSWPSSGRGSRSAAPSARQYHLWLLSYQWHTRDNNLRLCCRTHLWIDSR